MSTSDNMVPLVSRPWLNAAGAALPISSLPGLRSDAIQGLEASFPGGISPAMRALLETSCGLDGTDIGSIDFTGRWFPEEPIAVFRPCLTLAIDDVGRRWIAETTNQNDLPGPVWCVFSDPEVAVYVSDNLRDFLAELRDRSARGQMLDWLRTLTAQARTVWSHRHALAVRSHDRCRLDDGVRGWLWKLPFDAYLYDLRAPMPARGWPYGLAGPSGRLYRCGRLPVFAVAGWPSTSRWAQHLSAIAASYPLAQPAVSAPDSQSRRARSRPARAPDTIARKSSGSRTRWRSPRPFFNGAFEREVPRCAS